MSVKGKTLDLDEVVNFKKDLLELSRIIVKHIDYIPIKSITDDIKALCAFLQGLDEEAVKNKGLKIVIPKDTPAVVKQKKSFRNILDQSIGKVIKNPFYLYENDKLKEPTCGCEKVEDIEVKDPIDEILMGKGIDDLMSWFKTEYTKDTIQKEVIRHVLDSVRIFMLQSGIQFTKRDLFLWELVNKFPYAGFFVISGRYLYEHVISYSYGVIHDYAVNAHELVLMKIDQTANYLGHGTETNLMFSNVTVSHNTFPASVSTRSLEDYLALTKDEAIKGLITDYLLAITVSLCSIPYDTKSSRWYLDSSPQHREMRMKEVFCLIFEEKSLEDIFKLKGV